MIVPKCFLTWYYFCLEIYNVCILFQTRLFFYNECSNCYVKSNKGLNIIGIGPGAGILFHILSACPQFFLPFSLSFLYTTQGGQDSFFLFLPIFPIITLWGELEEREGLAWLFSQQSQIRRPIFHQMSRNSNTQCGLY